MRKIVRITAGVGSLVALLITGGCGLIESYRQCADADPVTTGPLPQRLSATGLFRDGGREVLADGVMIYRPRFELWSDGATKRRWLWLPPGSRIDTGDMDDWQFPVGTKLWKEFSRDGVRVETRLLQRVGAAPDAWAAVAYLWAEDGRDAVAVVDGAENPHGTSHVVPSAAECAGCHGGRQSRVLGFSAVQLSHDDDQDGGVNLEALVRRDLLTAPPAAHFTFPGNAQDQEALGYLHANCAHCHNQARPMSQSGYRCFNPENGLDFRLRVIELGALAQTGTFRTAVGNVIKRGDSAGSEVVARMSGRDRFPPSMPPLGTQQVDVHAVAMMRDWIDGL